MKTLFLILTVISMFVLGGCMTVGGGKSSAIYTSADGKPYKMSDDSATLGYVGIVDPSHAPNLRQAMAVEFEGKARLVEANGYYQQPQKLAETEPGNETRVAASKKLASSNKKLIARNMSSKATFSVVNPVTKKEVIVKPNSYEAISIPKGIKTVHVCTPTTGCGAQELKSTGFKILYDSQEFDYIFQYRSSREKGAKS